MLNLRKARLTEENMSTPTAAKTANFKNSRSHQIRGMNWYQKLKKTMELFKVRSTVNVQCNKTSKP